MFKKIEATDVFIFLGLVLIGTGLFLWLGLGISLTVVGVLFFLMGYFKGTMAAIRTKK